MSAPMPQLAATHQDPWWSQSLAHGAPGTALLHITRARAGHGSWDNAHRWATAMTGRPATAHPNLAGLFLGVPAIAYVLNAAGHPAYERALTSLDRPIATLIRQRLRAAHHRLNSHQPVRLREFDLMRGLTGLGVYILHRHGDGDLLREVLAYLVRLTHPLDDGMPGWWSSDGPNGKPSAKWPGGHGNLGLAHGITGPLALLAAAMRRDITVDGQSEAISRIVAELDRWQRPAPAGGVWWPGLLTPDEWATGTVTATSPQRPSWCYGTPGLARAQQLAALAMADQVRLDHAGQALAACVRDEMQLSQLTDGSLCHGWAGLVRTVERAVDDDTSGELATVLPALRDRLAHWAESERIPERGGLLEGPEGIHLCRSGTSPPTTIVATTADIAWDACLLLDG
ncbi:lanthionine synthetase C family protein [Streptomyces kanamyceticus]|uniref:Lanthionine synthetase n=1 Tax=Streptomyces kanamyceticus TaxID=1967 RepID=A0A5J6GCM3_STRKN|nr:lanthionine synthetase C family protein [Streptomyces kanamyceticus]QEU92893.1 lanthionine synthetase [Streptomyces kanamyceticus]